MKLPLCFGLAAGLFLAGCGAESDKSATATNTTSSGSSPAEAPAGYLGAITKAQQNAVQTVDTVSLNQAIQLFSVDKGRYPKDLNELAQEKYVSQVPTPPFGTKLVYDADAGKVKVVKE
jgi:stage V sporulation protein SpoVS